MTPAEQLRAQARALLALADEIEAGAPQARPADDDQILVTGDAQRLLKVGSSTAYRLAREHGLGWQTPSGSWRFSRRRVLEFLRGENGEPRGDFGE